MANHIAHHTETGRFHVLLDRGGDVADAIANLGLLDADIQRLARNAE